MKTKDLKQLENIAEICFQLMSNNSYLQQFMNGDDGPDSVEVRSAAINAALAFDQVESAALRKAENAWNYEWYYAVDAFVLMCVDGRNPTEAARISITSAGLS